jgi:DNA-binding CsgD family transcriptional regulator
LITVSSVTFDRNGIRGYTSVAAMFPLANKDSFIHTSEDLGTLASEDFQDIFDIIHTANCTLRLSEMRAKIVTSLKQAFRAEGVAFFLSDKEFKAIDNASIVGAGVNPRFLDRWVNHYSRHDPFRQEGRSRSTVCKVDDILPYKRWVNLKIYNEFYRPQNIHYKLSMYLGSSSKVLGLIGIFRPREHQDFSRKDVAKARILAPHLTTALENVIQLQRLASPGPLTKEYRLTKREIDIVRCVCQGLTNDEIGERLYISRFTVETHVKNIFDKTGVKHRAGLASLLQSP